MTTTDQQQPASGTVVPLDALKRRKRLDQLLATRSLLATVAAQQRSHRLDDAQDTFGLQLLMESTIRDEFPAEHEQLFPDWVSSEAAAEHPSGVLTADCGICRSVAAQTGLNLLPPEAA